MSSGLVVDNITNSLGTSLISNGQVNFAGRPGTVLEHLEAACLGQTVTGVSGSYTWPSVSTGQALTTSYADATGSTISYTPPAGTKRVVYSYSAQLGFADDHCISHWKLFIDGVEVVKARQNRAGRYPEDKTPLKWIFEIGTDDPDTGQQVTWTTPKTIKWQARDYSTGNRRYYLHWTDYWDGVGSNQFSIPLLSIIALS